MIRRIFVFVIFTRLAVQVASDCNCKLGCARNPPGRCRSCKEGWDGPFCQRKNVALNGTATQIGTSYDRLTNKAYTAELAIDGNTDTDFVHGSCTHTDRRYNSWWSVQLGDNGVNQIRYMKIYNREEKRINRERRRGMEILIDGKRCKKWPNYTIPETIEDVTCSETLTGHNLRITVLGKHFSLCEVQVFVCSDGWFGEDCDRRCKCLNSDEVCHKVTGRCKLGCQAGYEGDDCMKPCRDGRYGQGCSEECAHCMDNQACNKSTGHCPRACVDWWKEPKCDVCRDGRYGLNCSEECGHCVDNQACDKTAGHCPGACEDGWGGQKCDKCSTKSPVQPAIVAAVVTGLLVLLSNAGIFLCLLRHQRLQWVKKSTKKPDQEMSNVEQQPTDSSAHAHSSGHVESNYAALDTSLMTSEPQDKTYEAIKNIYQNT